MAAPGPIQTEYIRRMRFASAQSLLSCPDLEVSDIALASGLCDQSHFTNAFRRVTGRPPRRYRLLIAGKNGKGARVWCELDEHMGLLSTVPWAFPTPDRFFSGTASLCGYFRRTEPCAVSVPKSRAISRITANCSGFAPDRLFWRRMAPFRRRVNDCHLVSPPGRLRGTAQILTIFLHFHDASNHCIG